MLGRVYESKSTSRAILARPNYVNSGAALDDAQMFDAAFFGISPNAFGAIGALINFGVAYVVSHMTAAPPEHIQHIVEDIRVPHGAGEAISH